MTNKNVKISSLNPTTDSCFNIDLLYLASTCNDLHYVKLKYALYLENGCFFFTDKHSNVRVPQVCAVNLPVPSSGIHVREGVIDLQSPNAFVVDSVRRYTSLLTKGPKADGPVRAAGKALGTEKVEVRNLSEIPVSLCFARGFSPDSTLSSTLLTTHTSASEKWLGPVMLVPIKATAMVTELKLQDLLRKNLTLQQRK